MVTTTRKKIPAEASEFLVGACEFAAKDADPSRGKIKLVASSGQVFNHWYWGPIVFEMAGMRLAKPRLTLDYCHWQHEVVGFADQIDVSDGELRVAGQIVSAQPDDRAAEILVKGRAGVPYEASLKFDPCNGLVVEEYAAGVPAVVNGRTESGPLTVIRECLIRGVAVCPYGADPYTKSEFSLANQTDVEIAITHLSQEDSMPPTAPATDPAATPAAPTPEQVRAELVAANKEYADRFGTELAAKWGPLGESKPLLECYAEFTAKLQADAQTALTARDAAHAAAVTELEAKLAAAEKKATEAEERLASLSLGESAPVTGTPAKPGAAPGVDPKAAAFAAEFALPTK